MTKSCGNCARWTDYKAAGSVYGRCEAPRGAKRPQPYWRGVLSDSDQIDTAASHGADCKAHKARI